MKRLSFRLDGLLSDRWPIVGIIARVPAGLEWPPNFWTTIRFFGAFWVILFFNISPVWGALCFAFCLYTDALDGLMARRCRPLTYAQRPKLWLDFFWWLYVFEIIKKKTYDNVGEWFDPLADKVFIITCFYYFGLLNEPLLNPILFYTVMIVELSSRGVIIPVVRKVFLKKHLYVKANKLGKAKFITESLVGLAIMFYYLLGIPALAVSANFLLLVAVTFSLGSVFGHLWPERFIKLKLLTPD